MYSGIHYGSNNAERNRQFCPPMEHPQNKKTARHIIARWHPKPHNFPEKYGARECGMYSICLSVGLNKFLCSTTVQFWLCAGWEVNYEQLQEVAEQSGVLQENDDYLDRNFRQQCEIFLPEPLSVEPSDCATAFLFLCKNIQ